VAVALSFDFDNETVSLRDNNTTASNLSRGQYGSKAGLPRVLDLLRRHEIRASFFIPAVSALIYREDVADIVADGHEIGVHGWIHERNSQISGDVERELIERALNTLTEMTGTRPVGLRTPSWDYSPNTLQIVRDLGFLYDSSLMADDWPYEIVANGEATGIVELPVEWILDDAPYFGFSRYSSIRPHSTPDDVLSIWKAEFDMAHAEGGMFLLTMHPHVIGHRSRIAMLERLIEHIGETGGAWYATHEEVARYALENAGDGR
jgi:peptidoglycan/xylan/chitin deacetylase (PgdA/CDA1 family)